MKNVVHIIFLNVKNGRFLGKKAEKGDNQIIYTYL
jgi:hypothetical protein